MAAALVILVCDDASGAKRKLGRRRLQATTLPAWCQYVPDGQKSAACRGSGQGCTCDSFCQSDVPKNTWMWNPQCCGCNGAGGAQGSGSVVPQAMVASAEVLASARSSDTDAAV